jgi:hypothetical protein
MHLQPTHPERLCDPDGRPYFLWDVEMTLADYLRRLDDPDEVVRAYWIGVALRQAKPDNAIALLGPDRIVAAAFGPTWQERRILGLAYGTVEPRRCVAAFLRFSTVFSMRSPGWAGRNTT